MLRVLLTVFIFGATLACGNESPTPDPKAPTALPTVTYYKLSGG
ncbi:MAG: hypothetical protein R3F20_07900 [Planctomycetota bacterium]